MLKPLLLSAAWLAASAGSFAAPGQSPPPSDNRAQSAPAGRIDELVFTQLRQLGISPAAPCSDAVFVRRAYLDVIGTLPSPSEAGSFLQDRSPAKRRVLIERLLERDEFADYWAMKWSDLLRIKAEFPVNLWPHAAQGYHRWIRDALRRNLAYDRFARDLLTASGSNFRVPPVNFYRAMQNKEPEGIAQTVALTFMGERAEKWPHDRLTGMAGFFSKVGYKYTSEWKEEIVFFDPGKTNRGGAQVAGPAIFPDGTVAPLAAGQDPRQVFADWLVSAKNPWFARNIVNRIWSWLLGRGIIHEPDDIRPDNPPANQELLAFLEQELVSSHYDLKHVYRLILTSQTYQLSAAATNDTPEAQAHFAHYPLRRLEAEVLIDALNKVTGTTEQYTSAIPEPFTYVPENQRSIALPDGSISSPFLELFGRPPRDTGLESERNNRPTAAQELHLLNSSHIQRKLEDSPRLRNLLESRASPREKANGLYLLILSRFPTEPEWNTVAAYSRSTQPRQEEALLDVAWALLNSAEFRYRH